MLRRTKKEKDMCTPETLNHYIGRSLTRDSVREPVHSVPDTGTCGLYNSQDTRNHMGRARSLDAT